MVCWNHGRRSMNCVLIFVHDVGCTRENPPSVVEGVWSMCNTMKTGSYSAWLSPVTGQTLTWAPSTSTTDDAWRTDTFSCWCARELDMHWVARRIVQDRLDYREVCHRIPQMMTKLIVCDSTCYTDQRGQFWRWSTKPKNRKRMCDRETVISLQQRKWKHWH